MAMITCKEVSQTVASDPLAAAGWRRRLAVRIHLLRCRHCRRYADQMRAIGDIARRQFRAKATDPGAHERLRQSILDRLPTADEKKVDPRE